jgi:hypothetical protein
MDPSVHVMVANVDYETSYIQIQGKESGPECTRSTHLQPFMTDVKQGDDDQRKFSSSSLRTQRLPVLLLRPGVVVLEVLVPQLRAVLIAFQG